MKRLEPAITEQYELDVIECECGFHIGLDITYMDQVEEIIVSCPSCGNIIRSDFGGEYRHCRIVEIGLLKLQRLLNEMEIAYEYLPQFREEKISEARRNIINHYWDVKHGCVEGE